MSEAPRRINTERSLNRPTEKRPAEAPASKTSLNGQPDFFQPCLLYTSDAADD